ncbi:MAG TPA: heterodisulfide reductase-related iron-sulfur binding cluster [Bryobacteraceae bacterium]|jgi:glycolate oxidase iron-sulfur subunit|nr:heterodisulfide reductase-related iron-sulfur binding cluster [Bryobacteraceae bacterium]
MAASDPNTAYDRPQAIDLEKCVHCGLCLNSCPTYRELGLEMDSPRGRIYQMVQVSTGAAPISDSYVEHIELCLACRGCESACPSGVQYGRLVEAARAEIENARERSWHVRVLRNMVFHRLLPSRRFLQTVGNLLLFYQASGLQKLVRRSGILRRMGRLGEAEALAPAAEYPFFYRQYGKVLAPEGVRKYRVAFLGGCIANISFARLNEATVRVLRKNGCEVTIPEDQTCCGALHVHAGIRDEARELAKINMNALLGQGFDAIITNAAGCGSTLKEYHDLFEHDPEWGEKSRTFSGLVKDVTEFLASIELDPHLGEIQETVTYQDSCHLAHGQKVRTAPRKLLQKIPGLKFQEMPLSDICCGSAGIYNVVQNEMSMAVLEKKMACVNRTTAAIVATANPGCMLQLCAGVSKHGHGQQVKHIVELLDESYTAYEHARRNS